jgi:hypothetical protein
MSCGYRGSGLILGTARRSHVTLLIPESAFLRVCTRLKAQPLRKRLTFWKPEVRKSRARDLAFSAGAISWLTVAHVTLATPAWTSGPSTFSENGDRHHVRGSKNRGDGFR